jgi:hypothetical protein
MDINIRSFGGQNEQVGQYNGRHTIDPSCNVDHAVGGIPSQVLQGCTDFVQTQLTGGQPEYVAPNLNGQHVDELVLGAEYQPVSSINLALTYTHRTIGDVIEDMSTDGANTYVIANPGRSYHAEVDALEARALEDFLPTAEALRLQQEAGTLALLAQFDPPSRNYDAITARVDATPTPHSLVIASYTYAVERGNYPGLFSTETNQLDPNITSQYDLPDLMPNRFGPSGLDRPHSLKVDGFYMWNLQKAGLLITGVSFRAESGVPSNTLAAHPVYGLDESYLLPRGELYRSPATTQLDTHISYGYQLARTTRLEGFVDIFNLLNSQDELGVDERYTTQVSLPIVGGDASDLLHAKRTSAGRQTNNIVTPSLNYGKTNVRQTPLTGQLGFRLTF